MKNLAPDEKAMLYQIDSMAAQVYSLMDGIAQAPRTNRSRMSNARLAFMEFLDALESAIRGKQY